MQKKIYKLNTKTNTINYLTIDNLDDDIQNFMFFVSKLLNLNEEDEDSGNSGFTMDDLLKMIKFLYEKKGITNFENLVKMANFKGIFANNPKFAAKFLNNAMGLMAKSNFDLGEYDKLCSKKLNSCIKGGGSFIDFLFEKTKMKVFLFKNNRTKFGVEFSKLEIKNFKEGMVKSFKLALKVLKFVKKISVKIAKLKKSKMLKISKEQIKSRNRKNSLKRKEEIEKATKKENIKEKEEKMENISNFKEENKEKIEEVKNNFEDKIIENKEIVIEQKEYEKQTTNFDNNINNQETLLDKEIVDFINNKDAGKYSSYEMITDIVRDNINRAVSETKEVTNNKGEKKEKREEKEIKEDKIEKETIKSETKKEIKENKTEEKKVEGETNNIVKEDIIGQHSSALNRRRSNCSVRQPSALGGFLSS